MPPTLYFSLNPNPRLAVATARQIGAPVTPEYARPFANPEARAKFRALNPNGLLPILVEGDSPLWETDAIACRMSAMAGSSFWRTGTDLPDMIRWISWGKSTFVFGCDMVSFEFCTKQRYEIGPVDWAEVEKGDALFADSAKILNDHLTGRDFLLDSGLSYADFRMATFLPYNDVAGLPIGDYPAIAAWAARLEALPAWSDPFDGLDVPELKPLPHRSTYRQ